MLQDMFASSSLLVPSSSQTRPFFLGYSKSQPWDPRVPCKKKTCLASLLPTINWEEFIFTSHPNCRSYSTREPIRSNFVFHLSHLEASKLQEDQSMCQNVKQHNHLTVKRFVDSSLLFLTRHQTWPNWCGRRRLLLLLCPVYYYQVGCLVW